MKIMNEIESEFDGVVREVLAANAEYNRQGWHDAAGQYYRLLRLQVREVDADGARQPASTIRSRCSAETVSVV